MPPFRGRSQPAVPHQNSIRRQKEHDPRAHHGKVLELKGGMSGKVKTAALALSEAFTAGLSKTRFVVWWSDVAMKFVPGL